MQKGVFQRMVLSYLSLLGNSFKMEREERLQNLSSSEKKMRELFGWVAYIVVLVCIVHLTVTYVGQRTVVAGDSMLNTLHNKDNLIIDKVSYRFRDPERYEIIVFPFHFGPFFCSFFH